MPLEFDKPINLRTLYLQPSSNLALQGKKLKILHTSDWHLGRSLLGVKRRQGEQQMFLSWLTDTLKQQEIDVLLVAGDIFDGYYPSPQTQELYYDFLKRLIKETSCQNVVISSGNHDSTALLKAPSKLLEWLNIYVVSEVQDDLAPEVLTLYDKDKQPILIVGAVPFLKDKDIRLSLEGESINDRDRRLDEGTLAHYQKVAALAEERLKELGVHIPTVAMGHLFAVGGKTSLDDGTRDLYPGGFSQVHTGNFPKTFDYVALGHLHSQQPAGSEIIRYSGAPIPMSFNEASTNKSVTIVTLGEGKVEIEVLDIPIFQKLSVIKGDTEHIQKEIAALARLNTSIWLEIQYRGYEAAGALRMIFDDMVKGTLLEVVSIKNETLTEKLFSSKVEDKDLAEFKVEEVFNKLLDDHKLSPEARAELNETFSEILLSMETENSEENYENKNTEIF
ncbi:MAG: exonuclease SbcCD subunit D C-terminal domain-containing protein [Deltaproteobacteria bacterium]|nr:exonuclease SbcCD subunit D C-terminal domain-containing protein [Deltaproteobacteria bacterium]